MPFALRLALPAVLCSVLLAAGPAGAARVAVLSNRFSAEVANDFNAHFPAHRFTAIDVSNGPPSLQTLLQQYDEILLFEDSLFDQATTVGNRVYEFVTAGRPAILGTFYEQDRSDRGGSVLLPPHGWGRLESIDPNTTDGIGAAALVRTLDVATLASHPLTVGIDSLTVPSGVTSGYGGGNQAKKGTQVPAWWAQKNANGQPDPAIAYRYANATCVIHLGFTPNMAYWVPASATPAYYQAWRNAFDYASGNCGLGWRVPASSHAGLAALSLSLLAAAIWLQRRRRRTTGVRRPRQPR